MKTQQRADKNHQSGYSLAEILVALAIFTIIFVAALMIYDRSNKVFNQSVQAADLQQSTRVAFEKLVSDIRLTGFDFDRDGVPFGSSSATWKASTNYQSGNLVQPTTANLNGHTYMCTQSGTSGAFEPSWPSNAGATVTDNGAKWQEAGNVQYQQPDEQIEYAGPAAITIRMNSNYETATAACNPAGQPVPCENGREPNLQTSQFPLVTTNNNEIITYALVSNNAAKNNDTITFYADLETPRKSNPVGKSKENKAIISGVDLTNNNPPYTLYRFTMKNGSATGTDYDTVPIADNIRSLKFHYYADAAGTPAKEVGCTACNPAQPAIPLGAGQFDPGDPYATVTERDTRASIKSIRIELVGMNAVQDNAFNDMTDTVTQHYRKYELDTLVVPRNIGKHGMKEFATVPPGVPHVDAVCAGACNAVYVTWEAPKTGGDVDSYSIVYDPGNCPPAGDPVDSVSYTTADNAGANLSGYAYSKVVPGQTYRFAVQAVNKFGAQLSDNCVQINVLNTTKPAPPASLDASGSATNVYPTVANGIQLYWPATATNATDDTTCADGSTKKETNIPFGENLAYVVLRSTDPAFKSTDAGVTVLPAAPSAAPGGLLTWTDTAIGNCKNYYYRIKSYSVPCGQTGNGAMNQGGNVALAQSIPAPKDADAPIQGYATSTQVPATPTGLGLKTTTPNPCVAICDVQFGWNAVSQDTTGASISINDYTANLYLYNAALGTWSLLTTKSVSGSTNAIFTSLDNSLLYRVTVTATQPSPCNSSAESAPVYWPCTWGGGAVTIDSPSNYGGDGLTSGTPWVIQHPATITLSTVTNIQTVTATLFTNASGVQYGSPITVAGPASNFIISLPTTPDDAVMKVKISATATGAGACTVNFTRYIVDYAPPTCALQDQNSEPALFVYAKGATGNSPSTLTATIKNKSTNVLKLKKVAVEFSASNADKLTGISIGSASHSFSCGGSSAMADFSSDGLPDITASQANYGPLVITFGKSPNSSPVTKICIEYQTPFGDTLDCQILPSAATCTLPAGSCQ